MDHIIESFVLENYRAFKRARHSLYRFTAAELTPAGAFLFAGWLRLEEKAKRTIDRASQTYSDVLRLEALPEHSHLRSARSFRNPDDASVEPSSLPRARGN